MVLEVDMILVHTTYICSQCPVQTGFIVCENKRFYYDTTNTNLDLGTF